TNALADEIIIMSLWAVLTVIYFVAAMIIAKIRKNENVQSGFIFNFPKVIVQIIASVGFGLIAGFIAVTAFDFYNPKNGFEAMLQFMAGALLGTLGTFLISTLIYNRGVKNIGKSLPIFAGSFASLAVFYLLVSLGLVGGVMNVPDVDKIKSVSFSVNGSAYNINEEMYSFISVGDSYQPVDKASEDKQYIEKVVDLHQAVVDNLHNKRGTFFSVTWVNDSMPMYYGPLQISVVYELENGKKIERFYPWYHFDYESIKDEYNAILDTDVYKNSHKITKCTAEEANVSLVEIRQHKVYSNNKLFDTTQIDNYKPGIEKTEEFKALLSERSGIDVETNQIVSIDGNAVIRDDDLYDTEFINKLYTSLKEEFTADKSLSKTERRSVPEYVDTDNVPNDIAFSVRMDFNLRSDSEDDMYNALRKKYGFGEEVSLVVDKTEDYIVTKESYPKTYKLIEEYIQSKDRAHVFIWQDSAILDQYLQK
ncbi:MAG: tripartite tricarboxylate transporter TctB family protein, partial [Acutalibacteraceae bacterium]|nr:tripartite tricarboxylate transporter TctB family protein [Acutalibacteraceae bacterium]